MIIDDPWKFRQQLKINQVNSKIRLPSIKSCNPHPFFSGVNLFLFNFVGENAVQQTIARKSSRGFIFAEMIVTSNTSKSVLFEIFACWNGAEPSNCWLLVGKATFPQEKKPEL